MRLFTMSIIVTFLLAAGLALGAVGEGGGDRSPASMLTKRLFSLSASGATAESVVRMIGQKAGIPVEVEGDLSKRVNYDFADTTLENALQQMAKDVGFDYRFDGGKIYVSKAGGLRTGGSLGSHLIELKYMEASEMGNKLKTFVGEGETIHVDSRLNALIFVGSQSGLQRVRGFVDLFDRMPQQILIEAKIVETNQNFSREIGFLAGDLANDSLDLGTSPSKGTAFSKPQRNSTAIFGAKYKIGGVAGRDLDLRLLAAETKGDARVVSRPKVVTINNTRALINSGLTMAVKTLSTVQSTLGGTDTSTSSTSGGSTVAGGLERVEAGLQLGVLPTVVNNNMVRLVVDVNNSQPDSQIAIDGVPAVNTNSANTSIIVDDGATAVIAGLIKQNDSNVRSGVPFLSEIPILGLLFRNDGRIEKNNEMIILITPRILKSPMENQAPVETARKN